mgnify:CR=1 FL=1|tara:strand:+ start:19211 stop:19741 length:531 start_codon:yes stop_codon:yes gene_type:complete
MNAPSAIPATARPLAGLADIVLPEPVAWWPSTPAWHVLLVLLLLALAALAWRKARAWARNAYRREAARRLALLRAEVAKGGAAREAALRALPVLIREVALTAFPRGRVAGLTGEAWLSFLDGTRPDTGARGGFVSGPGRWLADAAYVAPSALDALDAAEVEHLFALAERWVETHHV